jgi:hypothetical protein
MPLYYFTTCHLGELKSIQKLSQQLPNQLLWVGIADRRQPLPKFSESIKISFLDDIGLENISQLSEKYTVEELKATSKVLFAHHYYQSLTNGDALVYVSNKSYPHYPQPMVDNLALFDILLFPKTTQPFAWKDEKQILNSGMYQADCWAIKHSTNGTKFLDWWHHKIIQQGYIKPCEGLNADELWLNHVPILFEKVKVVRDLSFLTIAAASSQQLPKSSLGIPVKTLTFGFIRKPLAAILIQLSKMVDTLLNKIADSIWHG